MTFEAFCDEANGLLEVVGQTWCAEWSVDRAGTSATMRITSIDRRRRNKCNTVFTIAADDAAKTEPRVVVFALLRDHVYHLVQEAGKVREARPTLVG